MQLLRRGTSLVILLGITVAWTCGADPSRLGRGLDYGPHGVGFQVWERTDRSRPFHAPQGPSGGTAGPAGRPIQISIWYPVTPGRVSSSMTYADYLAVDGTRSDAGLPAMADRQRTVEEFVAGMQRLGVDADSARAVLRRPMGAVRDAPPAPGRFPLVVHLPGFEGRPMDQCVMFEYLASHGYVVAACPSLPVMPGDWGKGFAGVEAQIRDLEFVRSDVGALPWVDAAHWAASGFSYGGLGCVLAALQRGDASAVISLDGNIVRRGIRKLLETDERYRPGKLQSPFLLLVRGDNREQEFSFFDKAVNADRWRLRLRALEHADFMSAGLIQESAFPPDPAFETRLRGHEAVCRCIRRFLDAILRSDAAARAVLGAGPSALGIAPGQAELTIKRRKTQRQ